MKRITLKTREQKTDILVGCSLKLIHKLIPVEKSVIITDRTVRNLHSDKFPDTPIIEVGESETGKNLQNVKKIYEELLKLELDRSSFIIGIGGGAVCDIAGFVASTYMRGIPFGFVPTTLLAQTDAAIGGKNGINLNGYKNIIGTFNQPQFVLCNTGILATLPQTELSNGLAEMVKHGIVGNAQLFAYIEDNCDRLLGLEKIVLEKALLLSILVKVSIVKDDERDKGKRTILNYGHTLGHALEKVAHLPHGKAVALGMIAESKLAVKKGNLLKADARRIESLLGKLGLIQAIDVSLPEIIDAVRKDKKRNAELIKFVVINSIGNATIELIKLKELEDEIDDMC